MYAIDGITRQQVDEYRKLVKRSKKLERRQTDLNDLLREANEERTDINRRIAEFKATVMKEMEGT